MAALARQLLVSGLHDTPAILQELEQRWGVLSRIGRLKSALTGQAFCDALAQTIEKGAFPREFFTTIKQHAIDHTIVRREICEVLSYLLYVYQQRTAPAFARRYHTILTQSGMENVNFQLLLADYGKSLSVATAEAVVDWENFVEANPVFTVLIRPSLPALDEQDDTPPEGGAGDFCVDQEPVESSDWFDELFRYACAKLKGQERTAIEVLCAAGGEMRIVDLATKEGIGWEDTFEGFKNLQKRLNPKLRKIGWRIVRRNNAALLIRLGREKQRRKKP
ncbi:MAG: hypothetical protein RMJ88_15510 [Thermogemmata sp.]|nr:hypothetical protein [Thermogemmata sp.]